MKMQSSRLVSGTDGIQKGLPFIIPILRVSTSPDYTWQYWSGTTKGEGRGKSHQALSLQFGSYSRVPSYRLLERKFIPGI